MVPTDPKDCGTPMFLTGTDFRPDTVKSPKATTSPMTASATVPALAPPLSASGLAHSAMTEARAMIIAKINHPTCCFPFLPPGS